MIWIERTVMTLIAQIKTLIKNSTSRVNLEDTQFRSLTIAKIIILFISDHRLIKV